MCVSEYCFVNHEVMFVYSKVKHRMWIKSLYEKAVSLTSSLFTRQKLFPEFKWIYIISYFRIGKMMEISLKFIQYKSRGNWVAEGQLINKYPETENSVLIFLQIAYYKYHVYFWYLLSEIRNLPFYFLEYPKHQVTSNWLSLQ